MEEIFSLPEDLPEGLSEKAFLSLVSKFYKDTLGYNFSIELIKDLFLDELLYVIIDSEQAVQFIFEYAVFGPQSFERYMRTREFIPGLNKDYGEIIYLTNVASILPFRDTFKFSKFYTEEITSKYKKTTAICRTVRNKNNALHYKEIRR